MFCPRCGKELTNEARFCAKCGADLSASLQKAGMGTPAAKEATAEPTAQDVVAGAAPAVPDAAAATKRKNTARIVIAAIAAIVLVAGIGVGAWLYLQSSTGTPVDEEHFPDKSFCSFVATQLDTDGNGILSAKEVEQIATVDLSDFDDIQDVTGVAVFTNLQTFVLGPNTVETVDLSQNAGLIEINTQAGTTTNIHVPTGFVDNGGSLIVGNTNVYEGPDDAVVLEEKEDEEGAVTEGVLSGTQFHNGTLYVGASLAPTAGGNKGIKDGTAFFKESDLFLFADGKVFWLERTQATSYTSTVIYMANEDGSEQKEVAKYAHELKTVAYTNGWLFYSSSAGLQATNVITGETQPLNNYIGASDSSLETGSVVGAHEGNVVLNGQFTGSTSPKYFLINPDTWTVTSEIVAPNPSGLLSSKTTSKGVLTSGIDGSLSLTDYDGGVLWSKTFDFIKIGTTGNELSLENTYCTDSELFIFPAGYEASVQIINLETGDLNSLKLMLEKPKTASVEYANDSFVYIVGENTHLKVDRETSKVIN